MKNYNGLLERYQDIQAEIDFEKRESEKDYDLLFRLREESNSLHQILNSNFKEEFNKK